MVKCRICKCGEVYPEKKPNCPWCERLTSANYNVTYRMETFEFGEDYRNRITDK